MNRNMLTVVLVAAVLAGVYVFAGGAAAPARRESLRVGVYDSRAITIAYSSSRHNDNVMIAKSREKKAAEEAGDLETAGKIDRFMENLQTKRHLQGFGTAPVHDLLKCIEGKIPQVAREAGVDLIVSKWELDYLAPDAAVVDVTMELVRLYEPTAKAIGWIEQIRDIKPISEAEIMEHGH